MEFTEQQILQMYPAIEDKVFEYFDAKSEPYVRSRNINKHIIFSKLIIFNSN